MFQQPICLVGSLVNSHMCVGTHHRTLINTLRVRLFTEKPSFVFLLRENESRISTLCPHLKQTSDFNAACVKHCLNFTVAQCEKNHNFYQRFKQIILK